MTMDYATFRIEGKAAIGGFVEALKSRLAQKPVVVERFTVEATDLRMVPSVAFQSGVGAYLRGVDGPSLIQNLVAMCTPHRGGLLTAWDVERGPIQIEAAQDFLPALDGAVERESVPWWHEEWQPAHHSFEHRASLGVGFISRLPPLKEVTLENELRTRHIGASFMDAARRMDDAAMMATQAFERNDPVGMLEATRRIRYGLEEVSSEDRRYVMDMLHDQGSMAGFWLRNSSPEAIYEMLDPATRAILGPTAHMDAYGIRKSPLAEALFNQARLPALVESESNSE